MSATAETDGEISMDEVDRANLETINGFTPETRAITYQTNQDAYLISV